MVPGSAALPLVETCVCAVKVTQAFLWLQHVTVTRNKDTDTRCVGTAMWNTILQQWPLCTTDATRSKSITNLEISSLNLPLNPSAFIPSHMTPISPRTDVISCSVNRGCLSQNCHKWSAAPQPKRLNPLFAKKGLKIEEDAFPKISNPAMDGDLARGLNFA